MPVVVLTLVLFLLSGGVLWHLGINYEGVTSSPATKIHPASTLAALFLLWALISSGDPVGLCLRLAKEAPASLLLLVSGTALLLQIALRSGVGLAGTVDSFIGPALFMMLLVRLDARRLGTVEVVLHLVMLANALLGLAEFASGQLIFPYRLDGIAFESDTRSAAFQGHPLANALVTATYILALIAGGGRLPGSARLAMILLQGAALVTFGGRSAIAVVGLLGSLQVVVTVVRTLRRGRVSLLNAAFALSALMMAPLALGSLWSAGFFDQLLERFVSDGGSAHARIEMFSLFERIPWHELLFGPDIGALETARRINGLEWGIENPVVRMMLYQGVAMTLLMTGAVVLFVTEIARRCRPGTLLPILGFAILVNASESLAGKTTMLAKFAVILLALYRPLPSAKRHG
ncbi:hypothetical protein MPAR168_00385 [Methylorubrum populi]|uniref:O-antigen ligase-like membrane protein n=1 Tax=Methylobacterium radiotolerans TaxID=31998 RepID=A0ABU7T8F0_9HYPH